MIFLYCFITSNSRQDTLSSTAKTCHQMYSDTAGNNYFICISNMFIYPHWCTTARITYMHQVLRQTVVLIYFDTVCNFLPADCNILFSGLSTMCTLCNNDANIFIRHAA